MSVNREITFYSNSLNELLLQLKPLQRGVTTDSLGGGSNPYAAGYLAYKEATGKMSLTAIQEGWHGLCQCCSESPSRLCFAEQRMAQNHASLFRRSRIRSTHGRCAARLFDYRNSTACHCTGASGSPGYCRISNSTKLKSLSAGGAWPHAMIWGIKAG